MVVTLFALVAVPYFVHAAPRRAKLLPVILGLILAGVIGNFADRVIFGIVRDFLDVHTPETGALHDFFRSTTGRTVWPTFNVADMFITGGAIAMVLFFGRGGEAAAATPPAPADAPAHEETPPAAPAPVVEAEPSAPAPVEGEVASDAEAPAEPAAAERP
jgi:hypothetical protein